MSQDSLRQPLPNYRSLLRELFWTRTGLLVLAATLFGVGLLLLSSALPADSGGGRVAFALGTGLSAAALFTAAQTVISASAANRMLVEALGEQARVAMRTLTEEYRALNQTYQPTHIFEGSPRPDPTFNRQLTRDLEASQLYLFRGLSGRHTAARLLSSRLARGWEVRVVVADLRAGESLYARANYLASAGYRATLEETVADIRQQVRCGLVGLYRARIRCSKISVTVSRSPSLDRFEIFDHSVWVTLFSDLTTGAVLYPRALRFGPGSFMYATQRRDFDRIAHDAPTEVIEPAMTGPEFRALFERLTGDPIDAGELDQLAEEFERFRREFAAEVGLDRP